jgi:hypothetical protein
MKTFKSFIQLDEVERAKYNTASANKMAAVSYLAQTKDPGDLEHVGPEEMGPKNVKTAQGKRKADRLDNKQPFGEAESHQSKTTMKHINNPNAAEKKAAKLIKPGIKGVRDRLDMLKAAKDRGALKEEDVNLLSNLYDQLDENNQEIFLNQLEENVEALLAFAKTITEE